MEVDKFADKRFREQDYSAMFGKNGGTVINAYSIITDRHKFES